MKKLNETAAAPQSENIEDKNLFVLSALPQHVGMRLDVFLCANIEGLTRSRAQQLILQGHASIAEKVLPKNYKMRSGDVVNFVFSKIKPITAVPQDIEIDVVYEDESIIVVNKPKGMVVHPALGNTSGTLVNALLYRSGGVSNTADAVRPGIVHRIDKDTSGLLVVAKNDAAHEALAKQFAAHSAQRIYTAVCHGNIKTDEGTIDAPIGRHTADRKKMGTDAKRSKTAITHYKVIAHYAGFTLVECRLETGRTHQIRVHMAHIGHPVAGDKVYGPKKGVTSLNGQCLHAGVLGFTHPASGKQLYFESELPAYFTNFLKTLKAF